MPAHAFIQRWQNSGAAERANYQLFLSELCDFLDVPRPNPSVAANRENRYAFERQVTIRHPNGLTGSDLYKRNHFVLDARQGSPPPDGWFAANDRRRSPFIIPATAGSAGTRKVNSSDNNLENIFPTRISLNSSNLTHLNQRRTPPSHPGFLDTLCYFPLRERPFIGRS
jgi:hypothetical protein